jgi:hypothetical protein
MGGHSIDIINKFIYNHELHNVSLLSKMFFIKNLHVDPNHLSHSINSTTNFTRT